MESFFHPSIILLRKQRACNVLTDDCSLDTRGVLSIVRHPWYTGGILIVWARPLDLSAILTNPVVSGYFVVGAILEKIAILGQPPRQARSDAPGVLLSSAELSVEKYFGITNEAGALENSEKGQASVIKKDVVEKARRKDFKITRTDRFRSRTKYFTDSGIIGSKEFVFTTYQKFKQLFQSRHEKKPKLVKRLSGIYSLKRLSGAL